MLGITVGVAHSVCGKACARSWAAQLSYACAKQAWPGLLEPSADQFVGGSMPFIRSHCQQLSRAQSKSMQTHMWKPH